MSIAKETLPGQPIPAPPYPLDSYYSRYATLADEPSIERSNVLRMPAVTVATLRYAAPNVDDMHVATRGTATEASILLAAWKYRGYMSAWDIATEFQERYYGGRTSGFRRGLDTYRNIPRKGFDLIAATEALGYVQWWCDIPDPNDFRRFETVRLSEVLATFESSRS